MKNNLLSLFKDKVVKTCVLISFSINLLILLLTVISKPFLPPYIPLFNSLPWGESRLARPEFVFLIPTMMIFIFFINTLICSSFYSRNALMSRILSFNALVVTLLGLVAYIEIILSIL